MNSQFVRNFGIRCLHERAAGTLGSIDRVTPFVTSLMILLFISATVIFVRHNSHFISDDFDHFDDAISKSLGEMLATRIDVHFAPLHQLASYLLFKLSPLNFDVALGVMIAGWIGGVLLLYLVLNRLAPQRMALLVTLIAATSPAWLHILIWWSAAIHRIPYLLLQAMACFYYLRYRENRRKAEALLCLAMQVIALGFYIKAILFPVILIAVEGCLSFFNKKLSREGGGLCICMSLISAVYVAWYLLCSPTIQLNNEMDVPEVLSVAFNFVTRLGAVLLFLPIEQSWAEWVAGIFWVSLACWSIWRRPRSALPIAALLATLIISFTLAVVGRGALAGFPLASMRYYSDELFVVAIFTILIITEHIDSSTKAFSPSRKHYRSLVLLAVLICYPVGSYYASRSIFSKAYEQHRLTHDFMSELDRSLKAASIELSPRVVWPADFPAFVYGFMGARKPMTNIMEAVYPRLRWLHQPEQARGKVSEIRDDGQLEVIVLPDKPDFKDNRSFPDWSAAEKTHRWSSGYRATILFSSRPEHKYKGELIVRGPILGAQQVTIRLNGAEISTVRLDESASCCSWSVGFSPALLRGDGLNAFEFDLPDARKPGNGDQRTLAIGVQTVLIR
ncbi:hypothetical protein AAFN46_13220 [Pseudomonas sp. CAU 1711]|uniref:hypothetical protein n=1 Tax=Pseudomonas sp. CAU 1711 TaxID=3140356 RepID=UPI0032601A0E